MPYNIATERISLLQAPRMDASSLLGTLLTISSVFKDLKVLQPNSLQFQPIQTQHTKVIQGLFTCR